MKKELIIVGASGFGRELLAWFKQMESTQNFNFKGFIDDYSTSEDVIDTIENYKPQPLDVFVCAIGSPQARKNLTTKLEGRGAQFVNLIHPSSVILADTHNVVGLIVAPLSFVSSSVSIKNHNLINVGCSVGHDVVLGNYCTLSPHSVIGGNVCLEDEVLIGSQATIIPRKTVGAGAIVGAGSSVMRNVPAGATVVGVPAKRII